MTGGMYQVSHINMNNQNNTKHFKIIIAILAVALATAIAVLLFLQAVYLRLIVAGHPIQQLTNWG